MALTVKSIDEITEEFADEYDALIKPKKLWRSHNNKLYLILRSVAAGYKVLLDAVLALRNRFNPRYCEDSDLRDAMLLVGETITPGKKSLVQILVSNDSGTEEHTLAAGEYRYASASGEIFSGGMQYDVVFPPLAVQALMLASERIGDFPVSAIASLKLARKDGKSIDPDFSFSCLDNAGSRGRAEETLASVRQRILIDSDRQDAIREIEQAIKRIATIYECNLLFNSGIADYEYDGITLGPRELLVIITGVPSEELADTVVKHTYYATHMVTPDMVVYHYDALLAGGRHPVYYKFHDKEPFYLFISYTYDASYLHTEQIESELNKVFAKYKNYLIHIDAITEPLLYNDLALTHIPAFSVIKIYIQTMQDGELVSVPSVAIARTRLPELQSITYYAENIAAGGSS
jgi:hypothetical protein